MRPTNQFSLTTGAYVRGGILGLRGNTLSFPLTTQVLTIAMLQTESKTCRLPLLPSSVILKRLCTRIAITPKVFVNFLIGISEFQGGELWIERHGGAAPAPLPHSHLLGFALPVFGQCVIFDAHLRHTTMPWVGHCAVLVGFVIKGYAAISSADHCALLKRGFNTPDLCTGNLVRHGDLASFERPRFVAPAVPVVFELFSGSGRVTACLRKLGLHAAHGIDHVVVPEAASSTLIADPTTEEGQQLASFWITNPPLSAVFAAPPCGTCSRAFACENPNGSWFWNTSFFQGIAHLCPFRVILHHCAFGGHRPKRTTIASSLGFFSSLSKSYTGLTHTCRGMCPQMLSLPRLMPRIPHPLLMKSPRPLHVTLCRWRPHGALPQPSALLAACRAMANDQPEASKFPVRVPGHCAVILVRGSSQSLANLPCAPMARLKVPRPFRRIALAPAAPSLRMLSCSEQLHYRLTGVLLPMPRNPALRMPKSLSWPGVSHTARRFSWQLQ